MRKIAIHFVVTTVSPDSDIFTKNVHLHKHFSR